MSRRWTGWLQAVDNTLPLPWVVLLLFLVAIVLGLLWHFRPRWRRGRRPAQVAAPEPAVAEASPDELPDLPAEVNMALADRLAAEGRFAEAVRERLRAIVRGLVDRSVIAPQPGWTVAELARAAGTARPAVEPPLTEATGIFSDLWYGQQPATAEHDNRMRELAGRVGAGA